MTAGDIADHFNLAKPTLSGHFAVLKAADLVDVRKVGTSVIYRLNLSVLEEALMSLIDAFGLNDSPKVQGANSKMAKPA